MRPGSPAFATASASADGPRRRPENDERMRDLRLTALRTAERPPQDEEEEELETGYTGRCALDAAKPPSAGANHG